MAVLSADLIEAHSGSTHATCLPWQHSPVRHNLMLEHKIVYSTHVYCCQYMVDRASMHGTYAYFPGPCKNARMQRQTSKAAAVLLALLVEDNELAHARSLLAIHNDMTKAHAVRSTRQVPLKSFSLWVWCPRLTGHCELQAAAQCAAVTWPLHQPLVKCLECVQ